MNGFVIVSMPWVWVSRSDPISPPNPCLPFEFEDAMANYRQAKLFQRGDEEPRRGYDSDDRLGQYFIYNFCFLFKVFCDFSKKFQLSKQIHLKYYLEF